MELEEISALTKDETTELIFSRSSSLKSSNPREILLSDFKTYQERGLSVGIGQVEVITLEEVDLVKEEFLSVLNEVKTEKRLDWVMLLVTDVIKQDSVLFSAGFQAAEKKLIFTQREPHIFDLPDILSRKKQLFPEVYRVLEEVDADQ